MDGQIKSFTKRKWLLKIMSDIHPCIKLIGKILHLFWLVLRVVELMEIDILPGSLAVRPRKYTIPKGKDRLPSIILQGRAVKLREGNLKNHAWDR